MFLEIGLIGLLTVTKPNVLNEKPPDVARPYFDAGISDVFMNYEADIVKGSTITYKLDVGYKVTDWLAVGYETRKTDSFGYGNNADYVFVKISYRFER